VRSWTPATRFSLFEDPRSLSFVLAARLFPLLHRAHLSDDDPTLVQQRIIVMSLPASLALLLLSGLKRHALRGSPTTPFLLNFELHIELLMATPLLISAEFATAKPEVCDLFPRQPHPAESRSARRGSRAFP